MRSESVVAILFLWVASSHCAAQTAQEKGHVTMRLEILGASDNKEQVLVPGEPMEARVTVSLSKDDNRNRRLRLYVGSLAVEVDRLPKRMTVRSEEGKETTEIEYTFPLFFAPELLAEKGKVAYLFSRPGKHWVWVEDAETKALSAKASVLVRDLQPDEQAAFDSYAQLVEVPALLCGQSRAATTRQMDTFLQKHSASPYGPIVLLAKTLNERETIRKRPIGSKADVLARDREVAKLADAFHTVVESTSNAFIRQRALFNLALAKASGGEFESACGTLKELLLAFPAGAVYNDGAGLLKELEDHRGEWQKRREELEVAPAAKPAPRTETRPEAEGQLPKQLSNVSPELPELCSGVRLGTRPRKIASRICDTKGCSR